MLTSPSRHCLALFTFFLSLFALSTLGCSHRVHPLTPEVAAYLPATIPPATGQLLVAMGEDKGVHARLYALERREGGWRLYRGPLPATVGKNGFAPVGEKREGDGRTPSGLFPLEFVFGYAASAATRMPYRQGTENDLWVDDPNSPDYNRWVRRGQTRAASYEVMKLPDNRYRHGVVIGYNRDPVLQGMGSAIFLHAWLEEGRPTAGCVALAEGELVELISWLDPARRPMILMGGARELLGLSVGGGEGSP